MHCVQIHTDEMTTDRSASSNRPSLFAVGTPTFACWFCQARRLSPAGTIADALEIPPATLSFHLKELRSAGLVRCERAGRSRIYSPDFSAANDLIGFLTANCCSGLGKGCS